MTDLLETTALGLDGPAVERHGGFTISENADLALASLALRRDGTDPAPFGLTLPGPGGWVQGGGIAAFWTGPGQWMVEAPGGAARDFAGELKSACPDASVTEQTDGWIAFEIQSHAGANAITGLVEKLVNVDTGRICPGFATRTGLEHMSVFVIRRSEENLAVIGMRSAAGTLWHALTHAAARIQEGSA
ncbi:sarcosine oxidase subunit gamma [Paracoccus sp. DMF-8]|uniref:sarcosine oxidase subunit gamma n=1 Tax=Paracoccus sp. DMF-8 TaxID=3019445 RepID=UPI0023E4767E|nr:sarcosine oxidase subunit gamma [Paracoccus sp. DMF-8]MDF3607933.1 sarcosine oxidase subunit gamma [Paracoccus sp. DMF-8]